MKDLTFKKLKKICAKRWSKLHHNPNVEEWTYSDICMSVSGEWGELCNVLKKVLRGSKNIKDKQTKKDIDDEFADTIIYLMALADNLNIDIDRAVISKFNETSDKYNCSIKIK